MHGAFCNYCRARDGALINDMIVLLFCIMWTSSYVGLPSWRSGLDV